MDLQLKYNPWLYFLVSATALGLLSYFPLDPARKWVVGLLGLALPTAMVLWAAPSSSLPPGVFQQKDHPPVPHWPFLLLLVLAVFLRIKDLTSLSAWPVVDEGAASFYATELLNEGHWRFFYPFSQVPPAFFWLLALFFKYLQPSLFSLWLFPAFLSVFSVGFAYFALRAYFPSVLALVGLFLLVFNFWHLYTGRFCIYLGLLFFWEMLTFWALAVFLRNTEFKKGPLAAVLLGLAAGAGLFVAISWPVVLAMTALAVWRTPTARWEKNSQGNFAWFSFGILFFSILFLAAAAHEKYGRYIFNIFILGRGWNSWSGWRDSLLNFWAILVDPGMPFSYGPVWGGLLNPLEGALVLTGLVECRRNWKNPTLQWVVLGLALFLVPGMISKRYDPFRMLQVLPLLLILAVLGWRALANIPLARKSIFTTSFILIASAGLNLYHLWGPYHRVWGVPNGNWYLFKSPEFYRAYQILEPLDREEGPGAVLSDLWGETGDGTLSLACYAFDAAHNPHIPPERIQWVAVLTDPNYKPFLAKDFPQGRWYWLGSLYPSNSSGLMMGVLPMTPSTRQRLLKWIKANQAFKPVTSSILDTACILPGMVPEQKTALDALARAYPVLDSDPFMQSCYWEKVYVRQAAANNPDGMLEALRQGLCKGYPLAHFYNEKGILLAQMGKKTEARRAFQSALRAPLNLTDASENLKKMETAPR